MTVIFPQKSRSASPKTNMAVVQQLNVWKLPNGAKKKVRKKDRNSNSTSQISTYYQEKAKTRPDAHTFRTRISVAVKVEVCRVVKRLQMWQAAGRVH